MWRVGVVTIPAIALSMSLISSAWGQYFPGPIDSPALAVARGEALMLPKSPTEEPGAPRQWGNTEGTGAGVPVPGTGQAPKFFGQARGFEDDARGIDLIRDKEAATTKP